MNPSDFVHLAHGTVALHDARRQRRWSVDLEPFDIGVVPITQASYASVLGDECSSSRKPVTGVTWLDAVRFCNLASLREKLPPAYTEGTDGVTWHPERSGYRLPTEAEWEYACRAGSTGPRYGELGDIAWSAADGDIDLQDVGLKKPNAFGLFDTLGNVWEWCWDYLDPARYDDYRVFRGGGFADEKWSVRASVRRGGSPTMKHDDVGFRIARGGFSGRGVVQGWSQEADRDRARISGPVPPGWTPQPSNLTTYRL